MINKDIEGNYSVDLLVEGAKKMSGIFCVVLYYFNDSPQKEQKKEQRMPNN